LTKQQHITILAALEA